MPTRSHKPSPVGSIPTSATRASRLQENVGAMRLLDLFCGAGGAAEGYRRAGFTEIVGVDLEPQLNYPFEFYRGDALDWLETERHIIARHYDAIHASPPCQGYTPMTNRHPSSKPRLIPEVRRLILATGLPYVIENVIGAGFDLVNPIRLCGSAFGLKANRHRLFECSVPVFGTPCAHNGPSVAVYGKADGRRLYNRKDGTKLYAWSSLEEGREALEVPWMQTVDEVRESIPPAYTEYIGRQLIASLEAAA